MKKVIYAGVFLFLGAMALTSCKKDWICTCTADAIPDFTIKDATKKDAKKKCEDDTSGSFGGFSIDAGCSLK